MARQTLDGFAVRWTGGEDRIGVKDASVNESGLNRAFPDFRRICVLDTAVWLGYAIRWIPESEILDQVVHMAELTKPRACRSGSG